MPSSNSTTTVDSVDVRMVADLVRFMETGEPVDGLFAPDVFVDLMLPCWRLQAVGAEQLLALRRQSHASPGQVRVQRVEPTSQGFAIEFEEHWEAGGQRWLSREMIRADVADQGICELSIYCTGDWDEATQHQHAEAVDLLRP
jgi:hypothetical protein